MTDYCIETAKEAVDGSCPVHNGDACLYSEVGLVEKIKKMLPVYEAVQQYKVDFDGPSVEDEYASRSRVFDALENWQEGESPH